MLDTADLSPYDVQRSAHELWDYAELKDKRTLSADDLNGHRKLVIGQIHILRTTLGATSRSPVYPVYFRSGQLVS